uniref:Uncharacterized protein n=1 Tax=Leersia perrieri TaxID=77586 RepID=A0A0D9WV13_9ORYZ
MSRRWPPVTDVYLTPVLEKEAEACLQRLVFPSQDHNPCTVVGKNILMSEVIASAVIGEAVSRISTFLVDKYNQKSSEEDGLERLEMAQIRMEAALEISSMWPPVTDSSLQRWRKKLKRASDECSHVMDRCKRRAMEDDEMEQEVRWCSFPKRIAHATRSFISSFAGDKNVDSLITTSTIQRFERLADGAGEFLRFMEFGSIGRINYTIVDPLTGHLLAGKAVQYENSHGNQYYLAARPMNFAERGLEAGVLLRYQNHERPEENFILGILLRLATSTNVTRIMARCLELLPPNFKPVAEAAKQELTQVHQRGLYCFPFVDSTDQEYWSIHRAETHRARPNFACCKEHGYHGQSRSSDMVEPSGTLFPEPVIKLAVQRHFSVQQKLSSSSSSPSGHNNRRTPLLQLTAVFAPHMSPEQLPSGAESVAIMAIDGREEQPVRRNVGLRELEELLLPNAISRLCHEAADGSSAHEVFWRSDHGAAYLCVEKTGTEMAGCSQTHWPRSALVRQRRRRGGWWLAMEDRKRRGRAPNHRPMRESYMHTDRRIDISCPVLIREESYRILKMGEMLRGADGEAGNGANQVGGSLETSNKWQITGRPLLRWQKKLKRAAEECDDTLRKCRQHLQDEEEEEHQVSNSSFPRRFVHATKSLVSSIFHSNIDEPLRSAGRRFEWYAYGASDFLRCVEFGGTPHGYLFFDPLIGHLLVGESLECTLVQGNKQHLFWIQPNNIAERGLLPSHFKSTTENVRKQLNYLHKTSPGCHMLGLLKMEEMVGSAVVNETVNRIISGLIDKHERKSSAEEHIERLEMANIKLEAALETSNKWQITSGPLLRWQKKLKRAAQECEDTLHKCRQRIQEEEAEEQSQVDLLFEDLSDGANDFLRFLEFGGTPRRYLFFNPLIGHLLAGESLQYKLVNGTKHHRFSIRPDNTAEQGREAKLVLVYHDYSAPEDNFYFGMMLQLSESTNIIGTAINCLKLYTPHFESTTEVVRNKLTQLPTQDFSWVPNACSYHWDNIDNIISEWYRPNPLCCKNHDQKVCDSKNMDKIKLPDVSLEPVIGVNLLCQVSFPGFREQGTIVGSKSSPIEFPHLNVMVVYTPHGSSEDLFPAVESTVIEVINGNEQHCLHTNISLERTEEIMYPRAIDCFRQNAKATSYQMFWKSKHGGSEGNLEHAEQMENHSRSQKRQQERRTSQQKTPKLTILMYLEDRSSVVVLSKKKKFMEFGSIGNINYMLFGSIGNINYMLVAPLTGHLLAGKALQYESCGVNQYYLAARPVRFAERGLEAGVLLCYDNHERPEKNFVLGIVLRMTASTNVTGIVARCLESSLTPNFKHVAEAAKEELTQVHQRGFYCFPFVDSTDSEYWSIHHSKTHLARPNPTCCEGSNMVEESGKFPEPLIKLIVQRHISTQQKLSSSSSSSSSGHGGSNCSGDSVPPPLQLTAVFYAMAAAAKDRQGGSAWSSGARRYGHGAALLSAASAHYFEMEEVVGSAVVHETVNKIISGLIDRCERKSSAEEQMERLEMAQIKLEVALEASNKWQISSGPLLRWQKKLKRAAEECDNTIRNCRQRVEEQEEAEQQVRDSSFPRRIAHATKSLISSIFNGNIDEQPSRSAVRRFEWYADGASDFLRSVEFGGTPRNYLFFDSLIGHLLAGETLEYKLVQGNKHHLFWIRPNNIAERVEAKLIFVYNDSDAPEDNFFFGLMLQLSQSTDIVGTAIKASLGGKGCSLTKPSHLKLAVLFLPHDSSTVILPATDNFAVEVIDGEEQPFCHKNITLEQLDKIMLPNAIDSFNQNAEATAHKLLWNSKHGTAFFHVGKTRMKETLLQQQDLELQSRADVISNFLNLWVELERSPVRMQCSVVDWIQALFARPRDSKRHLASI